MRNGPSRMLMLSPALTHTTADIVSAFGGRMTADLVGAFGTRLTGASKELHRVCVLAVTLTEHQAGMYAYMHVNQAASPLLRCFSAADIVHSLGGAVTGQLVSAMGFPLTRAIVASMGPDDTAKLVTLMGPALTGGLGPQVLGVALLVVSQ